MLQGLNHLTLTVSDLDTSLAFYRDVLGFTAHVRWNKGAYLSSEDLWLCLNLGTPVVARDYSHIALSVLEADFAVLRQRIQAAGAISWQENQSEGDSFYFLDPDGHQLEIHAGSLESRLRSLQLSPCENLQWLTPGKA